MAEFTTREVTTVRRVFALRRPTNWAEVDKMSVAINQELNELGLSASDNRVTVDATDDEIVFWYEKSSEVSHG